jgi:lysophospholipase L1-like esterase
MIVDERIAGSVATTPGDNGMKVLGLGDSIIKARSDSLFGWAFYLADHLARLGREELVYRNQGVGGDTSAKSTTFS